MSSPTCSKPCTRRFVIQYRILLNGRWTRYYTDRRQTLHEWEQSAVSAQYPRQGDWVYIGSGRLLMRVKAYRSNANV